MTSWILGLIGAAVTYAAWRIIRAGLEHERQRALLHRRRDRTGRATLGSLGTFGHGSGDKRQVDSRVNPTGRAGSAINSLDHASTLPASFNSPGSWSSDDSCLPSSADHTSGGGGSPSSSC